MKPVAWLLVWAAAWMSASSQSSAQSSTPRIGYGWCYACNAYMPAPHDCVGLRTTPPRWQDDPTPVAPQKSQAEIDAENAGAWSRQAVADIRQFERTGDVQWLNSALKKLFNAEALLRRPSYYRASILSSVNKNIAWCYNEYARLYHKAGQWDKAEKYFRLAWNYHPDSDVYRGNIRKAQESREAEATAARQAAERQQAAEAFERGRQHAGRGEWEAAMKAFEQATRLVPDWQDYRTVLNVARENWDRQLAADAAKRAAAEQHRQEVAARVESSREYTRRQTDLRDAVVNERKQKAAEQLVEVKNPFGTESYVGFQMPAQTGQAAQVTSAYQQAETLRNMLRSSLDAFAPFAEMKEKTPVEALAQLGYTAQQGSEAMNGGLFRGVAASGEGLKKLTPGMQKLRAQMEQVMPVAARQIQELAETVQKVAEATKQVEAAEQAQTTASQEMEKARTKIKEANALPEDSEDAKKKKADHSAEARELLAAATKQQQEAEDLKKHAEAEKGKVQVELANLGNALQTTRSQLDTLLAGGELPDEKKKPKSEPPPPQTPSKP